MSMARLLRPFEAFMRELLSWKDIRDAFDLEGVTEAHVSCRQPNDSTGPTFKYGYVVRHPRYRRKSTFTMTPEESQIAGVQHDTCAQYIQLTRATHETVVYLHEFPCGTPAQPVTFAGSAQMKTRWDRMANHLDVVRAHADWMVVECDAPAAPTPVFVEPGWPDTAKLGALVAQGASWMLRHRKQNIVAASGLGSSDTVAKAVRTLPAHKLVTEDFDATRRRTHQVRGAPPPLAKFGDRSWPTLPAMGLTWGLIDVYVGELVQLGWRSMNSWPCPSWIRSPAFPRCPTRHPRKSPSTCCARWCSSSMPSSGLPSGTQRSQAWPS